MWVNIILKSKYKIFNEFGKGSLYVSLILIYINSNLGTICR